MVNMPCWSSPWYGPEAKTPLPPAAALPVWTAPVLPSPNQTSWKSVTAGRTQLFQETSRAGFPERAAACSCS
jgi:hypothetical protein